MTLNESPEGGERPQPPRPTSAPPGTEAKILVMAARYSAGFHLHHPADARTDNGVAGRLEGMLRAMHEAALAEGVRR